MSTTFALTSLPFLAMGDDIPVANFMLVTTAFIRAKYRLKVHLPLLIA
jgi:hypothetical protein